MKLHLYFEPWTDFNLLYLFKGSILRFVTFVWIPRLHFIPRRETSLSERPLPPFLSSRLITFWPLLNWPWGYKIEEIDSLGAISNFPCERSAPPPKARNQPVIRRHSFVTQDNQNHHSPQKQYYLYPRIERNLYKIDVWLLSSIALKPWLCYFS